MPYGQKFRNFPGYISEKNPLILDMNTCIAFYPAKDFSGKVSLTLVGVLKVFDNGVSDIHMLLFLRYPRPVKQNNLLYSNLTFQQTC